MGNPNFPDGGGEHHNACDTFDLNEKIIGSVDEGIRTRRQIASILKPPDPDPPSLQTTHSDSEPLKPLSTADTARHLNATFPGRAPQVSQLLSLLGEPGESSPPILVWGAPATGKTSIVRGALQLLGRPYAYVSCRSSSSPRMIFEAIINQLAGHVRSTANNYSSHRKCIDLNDFILSLPPVCATAASQTTGLTKPKPVRGRPSAASQTQIHQTSAGPDPSQGALSDSKTQAQTQTQTQTQTQNPAQFSAKPSRQSQMELFPSLSSTNIILVFDHAELLRTDESASAAAYLLQALVDLPRLTGVSTLSVMLISSISWDAFETGTGCGRPVEVHFQDYSDEQLQQILSKGRPPLYPGFLKKVLHPFARVNRTLTELNESMEPLFRKYLEPIDQGRIERASASTEESGRKLYTLVVPHLKAAMANELTTGRGQSSRGGGEKLDFEMSVGCRFLLLAAYIASRNPAVLDSAYLEAEEEGRRGKKRRKSGVSEQVRRDIEVQEEHLRGPLTFPLERLIAIFKSVAGEYLQRPTTEQGVEEPGHVHRQLTTLVGVGLVSKAGGDPMEGGAKYRCNASRELADKVARSVNFPLASYLLHG